MCIRDSGEAGTFDLCLDASHRRHGTDQLELSTRPRRGRQRKHRDRFEQVGLALPVRADEDIDSRPGNQIQVSVVAVISEAQSAE